MKCEAVTYLKYGENILRKYKFRWNRTCIKSTLREDQYPIHFFLERKRFRKKFVEQEKFCRSRQATFDNIVYAYYIIVTLRYKQTQLM